MMMDRSISPFVCLVTFLLFFDTIDPGLPVVFASERKLLLLPLPLPPQNTQNPSVGSCKPNDNDDVSEMNGYQYVKGTAPALHPISKQVNGTTWCIVKPSTSQEKLDQIIAFCCTQPSVDCKVIQAGGTCYLPPNKNSDASVVMNIYYKRNGKHSSDCYFQGSGLIVTEDPSVDKCIYEA